MSSSAPASSSESLQPFTLYGFHKPSPAVPSGSAFCQKLEAYCRFAGIDYKSEATTPNAAPKSKLPYVKFQDGSILADSHLIIRHLVKEGRPDLDSRAGLSDVEKADGNVYRGYLEDHVYPAIVYTRWMIPENYYDFIDDQFQGTSWIYKKLISNLAFYGVQSCLKGHGVGRHTPEEVESLLKISFNALIVRLIENQKDGGEWFFGKKGPSEVDAALYGVLATTAITPSTPLVNRLVAESPILSRYILTITERYFPEYVNLIDGMKRNLKTEE
ncbi:hypothetical protein P389DRAFT_54646 [Cystobasidium minutum MCA 4210]|uniref:uncharacterized protein n=1 Tax=Cystobasidium minutum MCA 4210 TaxID=1397322 RepID=UPI0034CFD100|eukprot:jgi/Rhomi1/54646/CE54645_622